MKSVTFSCHPRLKMNSAKSHHSNPPKVDKKQLILGIRFQNCVTSLCKKLN